jgi:hypothetical protein
MGLVLAIISGVAAGANYYFYQGNSGGVVTVQIVIEGILTVLSILSMVFYRHKRTVRSPIPGVRWFTFGFVICIIAFLGCASILLAMLLGFD